MGILDDVVVNAKSAASTVGKVAGQLVDASKLRISLAEINGSIQNTYSVLGKYVYENAKELVAGDSEAAGIMASIDELVAQKEAVSNELSIKQNKVICPKCGKASPAAAVYCSVCGTKLKEDAPAEEPKEEPEEETPSTEE